MDISGKKILITGASDGIGKAIALQLAKEDTRLILLGRNIEKLTKVKNQCIKNEALEVVTYAFDISDSSSVTDHLEKIRAEHPDLAAVINNAGVWQKLNDLDQFDHDYIENIINTNLIGVIKLTNTMLPVLRKQPEAAIINVSSKSGYTAQLGQSIYTASKYGVRGFTEVLQQDLRETTVRVAGVYQAGTNTAMFSKAGEEWPEDRMQAFIPPEELADVVVFMLKRSNQVWLQEVRVDSK